MKMYKISAVIASAVLALSLCFWILTLVVSGLLDDATVARNNMTKAADNFELMRRIVFYNVRLGVNVVTVEGKCSIEYGAARSEYICKLGDGKFIRNFVSDSNDIVAIVEQMDSVKVNVYHFRRTFKPQSVIPDIDFRGSSGEFLNSVVPDKKD